MNRTLLLLLIGIVVCLGLTALLVGMSVSRAYERAGETPWPAGLGPLTAAPARFPATGTNAAAAAFAELAVDLEPPDAVADYLKAELERGDDAVAEPPASVTAYLAEHEARLDAIRDNLPGDADLVWEHDPALRFESPLPNLLMHLRVARLLMIRALVRRDWHELRAASRLAPPLLARPEYTSSVIGLSLVRFVVAAAGKLPPPAPRWLDEVYRLDPETALGRSFQYETWMAWEEWNDPLRALMAANYVRHQRESVRLLDMTPCHPGAARHFARRMGEMPRWNLFGRIAAPGIGAAWDRAARYRAEREATINVLRAAAGLPIVTTSRCGGTWSSETLPDGRIRVSYSLAIPKAAEPDADVPLTRTTRARTTRSRTTPRST